MKPVKMVQQLIALNAVMLQEADYQIVLVYQNIMKIMKLSVNLVNTHAKLY